MELHCPMRTRACARGEGIGGAREMRAGEGAGAQRLAVLLQVLADILKLAESSSPQGAGRQPTVSTRLSSADTEWGKGSRVRGWPVLSSCAGG